MQQLLDPRGIRAAVVEGEDRARRNPKAAAGQQLFEQEGSAETGFVCDHQLVQQTGQLHGTHHIIPAGRADQIVPDIRHNIGQSAD